MIRVTILALEKGLYSTVTGPLEVLQFAGVGWNFLTGQATDPQFQVVIASIDGEAVTGAGGLTIMPQYSIDEIQHTDLILVSSGGVHFDNVLKYNFLAIPWLKQWYEKGAVIAGVCSGVCLLAEAGILDGKEATTHWGIAEQFRQKYPKVQLKSDLLVTDAGTIFCAGGVNAGLDLSLYLVEKYCGHTAALQCAKSLIIETTRISQSSFSMHTFNKQHTDNTITEAQDWLETNYQQDFSMDKLAIRYNMSPRNFMRRFKTATNETPLTYLHQVRIGAAKHAIETKSSTIEKISNEVGYEDVAFFRSLFRRYVGITPKAYREKFGVNSTH